MANNAKSPNPPGGVPQSGIEPMPFEEALKKLEKIVDDMEGGELPLEAMLSRFEEGTRLVKVCQTQLEAAEVKIQKLEKNAAGEVTLKPVPGAEG